MVTDGMMDIMIAMLEKRVSATRGLASRVILLQRAFMIEILKAERAEDLKDAKRPYLTALERKVKDDGVSELWFTALWEEQIHWLAFKCDFTNLTLSYAKRDCRRPVEAKGNALTCGAQDDGISCGFIAINTLAHNTLGDDIWTASLKIHDRLHWFNLVCTEYERDNAKLKYVETRAVDAESKSVATQSSHTIPKSLKRILNSPEPSRARSTSLSRILNPAPVPPTVLPPPVFVAGPTVVADVALPLSHLLNDFVDAPAGVEWLRSCTPWDELANAGLEDTSPAWGEEMRMDVDEESTALLMELYSIFGTQYSGKRKLDDAEAGNAAGPCKIARIEERPAKASKGKAKTAPAKSKAVILHPVGTSKTAKWEHKNNARYNEATEDDAGRLATFKTSIRAYDEFAEVLDSMNVRHSRCGKPYIMKTAYNTGNFKTHTKRCRGTLKYGKHAGAGGHPTVDTILKNLAENPLRANAPNEQSKSLPCTERQLAIASNSKALPCMGLSSKEEPLIAQYLARPGADGGGGRSVTKITQELYPRAGAYKSLSTARKERVDAQQAHEWLWLNDRSRLKVFSSACKKVLHSRSTDPACYECMALLANKNFKKAIRIECPDTENFKFTNEGCPGKNMGILFSKCRGLQDIFE
ncbi:hypothetical protein R3P38DRAFT_3493096 [Favolaschia claudopus]|uniref:Uncharacterized protein n=1 Tax=Favolaschia claudopus TaxID=2862362 RepID=A0AAW0C856_9AGAR